MTRKNIDIFLNSYLDEAMGSDDASLTLYRNEIICHVGRKRRIHANSPSVELFESEFEDMAEQLIEKLAREPFEMKCEIASLWRNGFTLEVKE